MTHCTSILFYRLLICSIGCAEDLLVHSLGSAIKLLVDLDQFQRVYKQYEHSVFCSFEILSDLYSTSYLFAQLLIWTTTLVEVPYQVDSLRSTTSISPNGSLDAFRKPDA